MVQRVCGAGLDRGFGRNEKAIKNHAQVEHTEVTLAAKAPVPEVKVQPVSILLLRRPVTAPSGYCLGFGVGGRGEKVDLSVVVEIAEAEPHRPIGRGVPALPLYRVAVGVAVAAGERQVT